MCAVVRRGWVGLNRPELMRNYPMIVIFSGSHWFEEVWKRRTTPNSWETSTQRARTPCAGVVRRSTVSTVVHVTVEVSRLYSWACAEAGWSANRATDIHRWGVAGDGEFNEWKKGRIDGGLGEWIWWKGLEPDRSCRTPSTNLTSIIENTMQQFYINNTATIIIMKKRNIYVKWN